MYFNTGKQMKTIIFILISLIMLNCADANSEKKEEGLGLTKLKIQNASEFDIISLYIHKDENDYDVTKNLTPNGLKKYDKETKITEFVEFAECEYISPYYVTFTRKRSDTDSTLIFITTQTPLNLNTSSGISTLSLLEDDFYFTKNNNTNTQAICGQ